MCNVPVERDKCVDLDDRCNDISFCFPFELTLSLLVLIAIPLLPCNSILSLFFPFIPIIDYIHTVYLR